MPKITTMRIPTSTYDQWKTTTPEDEPTEEELIALEKARTERLIEAREDYDYDDAPYA